MMESEKIHCLNQPKQCRGQAHAHARGVSGRHSGRGAGGRRQPGGEAGSMTLECKVNYIRAVSDGEVICHAKVLNAGRKVHVLEARALQGDKLVATAQATFICK